MVVHILRLSFEDCTPPNVLMTSNCTSTCGFFYSPLSTFKQKIEVRFVGYPILNFFAGAAKRNLCTKNCDRKVLEMSVGKSFVAACDRDSNRSIHALREKRERDEQ